MSESRIPRSKCKEIADNITEYINAHSMSIITVTPSSAKDYKKAIRILEDARDRLYEGKTKKVIKQSMIDFYLEEEGINK